MLFYFKALSATDYVILYQIGMPKYTPYAPWGEGPNGPFSKWGDSTPYIAILMFTSPENADCFPLGPTKH